MIDFANEKSIVFVPEVDLVKKIWISTSSLEDLKKKYSSIDEFHYKSGMGSWFKYTKPDTMYLNTGINRNSGLNTIEPQV